MWTDAAYRGRVVIVLACIGMYLCFVALGSAVANATEHALCTYFEALAKEPEVETAEWVGYPEGWRDMPEEWDYQTFTPLAGDSGILTQVKGSNRWLWGFRSLELGVDANGNWEGMHDFCNKVIIIRNAP